MSEYRFGTAKDWPKIIDFIDLVFSQASRPHDFAALIPKAYGDAHENSQIHAIALEGGEIRGCVGVLPFGMDVAGNKLRIGYVGSVSVHRLSRGAGHMKQLMKMQIDKAKAEGIDMMVLGGQRQRYGYFGFQPIGGSYGYTVTATNVRHALKDVDASGFAFEKLQPGEDSDYVWQLYQQQPVCGSRTAENFAEIALTFNSCGWLIANNGQKAGYLIASDSCSDISELVLEDASLIPAVLKAWLTAQGIRSVHISAAPHNKTLNRALAAIAEYYSLGQDGYALILNYANAIRAWMTLKNRVKPLSSGDLTLAIEGETLQIKVENGAVSVEKTDAPADAALSADEASQLLFGFNRFYAPEVEGVPADWFPLPHFIPTVDTF